MSQIKFTGTYCQIALSWMPQNITDDESISVQVTGAAGQQAIPRDNIDPDHCPHIALLGCDELMEIILQFSYFPENVLEIILSQPRSGKR